MTLVPRLVAAVALGVATLASAPAARAAESYDNCTGVISSLPVIITTPGTWCLKGDVATAMMSGSAISVQSNNVTIDCNGFKIGGLGAGLNTATYGIEAFNRTNVTVRNCTVRGFYWGVVLSSAVGGYLVEDNRFDGNTSAALLAFGEGTTIRDNQILHTGGSTQFSEYLTYGIYAGGTSHIVGNQVLDVFAQPGELGNVAYGIRLDNAIGGLIADNVIADVYRESPGSARSIYVYGSRGVTIRDNAVTAATNGETMGITCPDDDSVAIGNTVAQFDAPLSACLDGGNIIY
jgi:nitrous oxidase accessory protein NosD